ncbi:hypothetical protein [Flavobacterium hydatis]|uniref:Uncharacterized protein n=1 Tax=Flavobacterium hydatis TaxID=991 RepID=A0A086AJT0_FLAHY|nr:hypothetical protein [Flavobacterium hydatis]KFF16944.1 hypothetical protein IW20_09260 [Flavobacterium hydatis]OXA97737.1 hypothetical protein B0A62_02445 [Flavobacterium hydatis]
MKLHIEIWVQEKGYSANVQELFKESTICYKNNAYRASLLFSYLGFLTIIKEKLINSKPPTAYNAGEWLAQLGKIKNDRIWEEEVFTALVKMDRPVFLMSEDLRDQIKYWRSRRNDCAHYKDNEIDSHHTDAFWSFLKSNIGKITVEGGMQSLLLKFDEHFDPTQTPKDSDYTHLIHDIDQSVLQAELELFFKNVYTITESRVYWESEILEVYNKILKLSSPRVQGALIQYLKASKKDIAFLLFNPERIFDFGYGAKEIRKIWFERMLAAQSTGNPFNLYAFLLQNNIIPKDEIPEANEKIFNSYKQQGPAKIPENKDLDTLKANGFFQSVFDIAITKKDLKDYLWVNGKCDLIGCFIENHPLNPDTVSSIIRNAQHRNPSQWLVKRVQNIFLSTPEIKSKFIAIAATAGLPVPVDFQ